MIALLKLRWRSVVLKLPQVSSEGSWFFSDNMGVSVKEISRYGSRQIGPRVNFCG